jgi:hypothetical protein
MSDHAVTVYWRPGCGFWGPCSASSTTEVADRNGPVVLADGCGHAHPSAGDRNHRVRRRADSSNAVGMCVPATRSSSPSPMRISLELPAPAASVGSPRQSARIPVG